MAISTLEEMGLATSTYEDMGDDHFHIGRGGDDHPSPREDADGNLMESVVNIEIL